MSEPMSDSLVLNDVDDFAYRIWKAIETKKDDAARRRIAERDAQLIASTLQAAADRALSSIAHLADPDVDAIIKRAILAPLDEKKT